MAVYGFVITLDTETGEYNMQFNNVSDKGQPIDYHIAAQGLYKILDDFTGRVRKGEEIKGIEKEDIH